VHDVQIEATGARALGDLHQAPRVAGRHHPRAALHDAIELGGQQAVGHLGLEDIVDSRAAAAEVAVAQLDQREARDASQQRARLAPHLLAVRQMTGVVIGDGQRHRPERQRGVGQHLGDVTHATGQPRGRRVRQPVIVLAHGRAAAGGVGDHPVDVVRHRRRECGGALLEHLGVAGVQFERATAPLPARHDDVPAGQR